MHTVTLELENTLRQLDPASATSLEQVVRDVLKLAKLRRVSAREGEAAAGSYPSGHFEGLVGSWAGVEFELPGDRPPEATPEWK